MRRQEEIRDKKSSLSEGQEVLGEYRFDLFGKTGASEVQKIRKAESLFYLFCLFGKNGRK